MPRYRVEIIWISRDWTEIEVEAPTLAEAGALVEAAGLPPPEHLDDDPEVEVNVFPLISDTVDTAD